MSDVNALNKNGSRIKRSTRIWLLLSAVLFTALVLVYVVQSMRITDRNDKIQELGSKLSAYSELSKKIGVGKKLSREDIGEIFSTYELKSEKRGREIYYTLNPNKNIANFDGFYVITDSAMTVKDFGFINLSE